MQYITFKKEIPKCQITWIDNMDLSSCPDNMDHIITAHFVKMNINTKITIFIHKPIEITQIKI